MEPFVSWVEIRGAGGDVGGKARIRRTRAGSVDSVRGKVGTDEGGKRGERHIPCVCSSQREKREVLKLPVEGA